MKTCSKTIVLALSFVLILTPVRAQANTLVVKDIQPGGIIVLSDDFQPRLTGLLVPGMDHPLGQEILDFIKECINGQRVAVFTWTSDNTAAGIVHDETGCPFVVIEYWKKNKIQLNELLLKKGYARVDMEYLPDYCQHFKEIEKSAKENQLGIWSK